MLLDPHAREGASARTNNRRFSQANCKQHNKKSRACAVCDSVSRWTGTPASTAERATIAVPETEKLHLISINFGSLKLLLTHKGSEFNSELHWQH